MPHRRPCLTRNNTIIVVAHKVNMDKRKSIDPRYLEILAEEEYECLKGCLVRVLAINGYADEIASDTFLADMVGEPVIVRIGKASVRDDIHRWMDEWLDPAYPVEIVERGNLPDTLHSCWIYGTARSLYGGIEAGDIWAVVSERPKGLDIEDIAARLGGKVRKPPPQYAQLVYHVSKAKTEGAILAKRDKRIAEALADCEPPPIEEIEDRMPLMPLDEGRKALERTDRLLESFECLEDVKNRLRMLEKRVAELRLEVLAEHIYSPLPRFK